MYKLRQLHKCIYASLAVICYEITTISAKISAKVIRKQQ
jgi:hypothetical protein